MNGKYKKIISKVEYLFEEGEIEKAISTYKQLFEKYPTEKDVYIQFLDYLEDEFIIGELAWDAYEEKIIACNLAISKLPSEEHLIFHIVKLDASIFLLDNNPAWFEKNKNKVTDDIHKLLEIYPKEAEIYRRKSHVEYYLGDTKTALDDINKAIEYSGGNIDERVFIVRDSYLLQLGNNHEVIEKYEEKLKVVDENNIGELKSIYSNLIHLYHTINNIEKLVYYTNLLEDLE
jgi:tetratricopeptide (TPR) repeat protein